MLLNVELRNGGLEAVAQLLAGPFELDRATDHVLSRLREMGVASQVEPEGVRRALSVFSRGDPPEEGVVVARGTPPQPPEDARLHPHFPVSDTPLEPDEDPFLKYPTNVAYPGEVILQKTPPTPGTPGHTLIGTVLPASAGLDVSVTAGENVEADPRGTVFRSKTYGVVLFHKGVLRVVKGFEVSEDRMEARITVLPDPRRKEDEQMLLLLESLGKVGIRRGVLREALVKVLRAARAQSKAVKDVVVAQGRAPIHGREPGYQLLFNPEKKVGKLLDGGRIDFREADAVKNVHTGDPLAKIVPAVEPVPGYLVDGTTLQPKMERPQGLRPGENTEVSKHGLQVLAATDGMVVIKGGRFHVVDEYLVPTDVDYRSGNIRASGSVIVRGFVKPGFEVQAGRDVRISRDVEEGRVQAGGEVVVIGGVTAGSRIVAGKGVQAKYLQNARVDTGGDVEVKLSITNSAVYAKGKVTAVGAKGAILGGEVNAALGIEALTIGSDTSRTHVAVGVDLKVLRELETIEKQTAGLAEQIKILQSHLGEQFLKDPRSALAAIPAPMRAGKIEALKKIQQLYEAQARLDVRREELRSFNRELHSTEIVVRGVIHAGTHVTVGPASTQLDQTLRRVALYYDPALSRVAWKPL
ncbi:MAG: hypothetical protein Kow0092_22690 [Deferrisomatales bacterium]